MPGGHPWESDVTDSLQHEPSASLEMALLFGSLKKKSFVVKGNRYFHTRSLSPVNGMCSFGPILSRCGVGPLAIFLT